MPSATQTGSQATPYLGKPVSTSQINGVPYASYAFPLAGGDAGIFQTIGHMMQLVNGPEGVFSPQVRAQAVAIVANAVKHVNEIDTVFQWIKKNIKFRGEHGETLQSPVVTLNMKAGDCDDHSTLGAALLRSLGYSTRFKTVAPHARYPKEFSHVYLEARDKRSGRWVALDTTVKRSSPGWEPEIMYRSQTFAVPIRRRFNGGRALGWLGDDSFQPLPQVPLVPGVAAPPGLSPGYQALFDLTQPFAQAGASLLAHGQTANPNITGNLNFAGVSAGFPSAIPTWLIIGGVALVAFMVIKKR